MVERRAEGGNPSLLERFRKDLVIDQDDLDQCLVQQPELYWHVAEAHSKATAERDASKLDLEVAEAEEAQKIRDRAAQMEEKVTEGSIKEQLALSPRLQKLRKLQVEQKAAVDAWLALKESFSQRSFMLRELVPMYLSRLSSGSARANPRDALAEDTKRRLDDARAARGYRSGR